MLLAGTLGSGKGTIATAFLERLGKRGNQYCVINPEGDYAHLEGTLVLGDEQGAPGDDEIITALETGHQCGGQSGKHRGARAPRLV
jgi:hypothetical protein